jgi:hypothetical protein
MSQTYQQRTHALQQAAELFNHLVGAGQEHRGYLKAKALRGFQIDDEFEVDQLDDRRSAGLAPSRICAA